MLLVGDIGGTKTHLALFDPEVGLHDPQIDETFPSAAYPSLEAVVQDFLARRSLSVECAAFGIAGPVVAGRAAVTNLPWMVDAAHLQQTLGFASVKVLNDLSAIAYSVPYLEPADLCTLNAGEAVRGGTIAVIAPGTGLGEGFITWNGDQHVPQDSEGGHTDFGPTTQLEIALLQYLRRRFGRVSYERICAGIGMPNIYAFLRDTGREEEPAWLAEQLAAAQDHTPVIATAGLDQSRPCPICRRTLEIFVSILGAEAGNLALKVMSIGGVYIGGGIPPRILPVLLDGRFMKAFLNKGRLSRVLAPMPIHVILNRNAALLGLAHYGHEA
ncbi:MAG: glucokinase [Anaerolineae bacterium]|jgi:glucokinase|nr:glucokinase [Anaerolineae bacterium]